MEERIIDDEIGRGVRLKKTKDGFVDVTDELTGNADGNEEVEGGEEISFEFPVYEEEDEDLIGLDPAEAAKKKQEKEAEIARRKAECEKYCAEGEELLTSNDFENAALKFKKALSFTDATKDDETWEDVVGRCRVGASRAQTEDFTNPDAFLEQYVEEGVESFEYDMGYVALETIKQNYRNVFEKRFEELSEEETPLAQEVESKQQKRRVYLKGRLKNSAIVFGVIAALFLIALSVTGYMITRNFTTPDNRYLVPTIISGVVSVVVFIAFAVFTNKLLHAIRMYGANENLESTENGERLLEIRAYKELYAFLLEEYKEEETKTEISETTPNEEEA